MTKFLDLSPASAERLECAFILAESPRAHRKIDDAAMTKEMAYIEPVACRMWALFGEFATRHNYKSWGNYNCTGYPPIQHKNVGPQGNSPTHSLTHSLTHLLTYSPTHSLSSAGDYDERWEKPGVKLIDFGGHEHLPGIRTPNAVGVGRGGAKPRRNFGGFPKPNPHRFSGNPPQLGGVPAQAQAAENPAQAPDTAARPAMTKPLANAALPAWAEDK